MSDRFSQGRTLYIFMAPAYRQLGDQISVKRAVSEATRIATEIGLEFPKGYNNQKND